MEKRCSFCGRTEEVADGLYRSSKNNDVYICGHCGRELAKMMAGNSEKKDFKESPWAHVSPSQICAELDKHIIGQERAKKVLSVSIYNHFKRMRDRKGLIQKANILLAGPSGTGKTLLARTIADMLQVPFAVVDATSLTQAGYVGEDVEVCLQRLLDAADGNLEWAQKGIVFIDEIDKISRKGSAPSSSRDVSGEGVQMALLKLVEGSKVSVPLNSRRKNSEGDTILFDTRNVLFIAGGAFEGMEKQRGEKQMTGKKLTPDDLIQYGLMQEFVGRFPNLVQLEQLTEDDLVRILTEPKNCIVNEYRELFYQDRVKLVFERGFLHGIASQALERGVGARGLRSLMEETMMDVMFSLPDNKQVKTCTMTEKSLHTGRPRLEWEKMSFEEMLESSFC